MIGAFNISCHERTHTNHQKESRHSQNAKHIRPFLFRGIVFALKKKEIFSQIPRGPSLIGLRDDSNKYI